MERKDAKYFKGLATRLMFELSDQEAQDISEEFKTLNKQLKLMDKIDTEDVQEMIYPFEFETHFMREDEVNHVLSQKDALMNVHKLKEGHVLVPKVVK